MLFEPLSKSNQQYPLVTDTWSIALEPFDSSLFGQPIARLKLTSSDSARFVNVADIQNFLKEQHVRIVYAEAPLSYENESFLRNFGFMVVSSKVTYEYARMVRYKFSQQGFENSLTTSEISQTAHPECFAQQNVSKDMSGLTCSTKTIYPFSPTDPNIQELAHIIGSVSHYAKDPRFTDFYKKIYQQWIINSFNGYADEVFVIPNKQSIIGLLTLKKKAQGVWIDLLGICKNFQGQGLATAVLEQATIYAQQCALPLFLCTQAENLAASRLYQKNGFVVRDLSLIYHKWI